MERKTLFLVCLAALLAASEALAIGSQEVTSRDPVVLAQSTVNNEAWAFNIDETHPESATAPAADFLQNPADKMELFRVLHTNDSVDRCRVTGSFEFVHTTNPTIRRPFRLEIWEIKAEHKYVFPKGDVYVFSVVGKKTSGPANPEDGIEFDMAKAVWEGTITSDEGCISYYSYEARLALEDWAGPKEPGDYYADLTVTPDGGAPVPIRIKGYFGDDFAPQSMVSNFSISEGASTHNIDLTRYYLDNSGQPLEIARINFLATDVQTVSHGVAPSPGMYSILISPTRDYNQVPAGEPSPYHLILERSENATRSIINTVWYDFDFSGDTTTTPPFALREGSWVYEKKVPVVELAREEHIFVSEPVSCSYPINSLPISIVPRFQAGQNPEQMAQGNYYSDIWFIVEDNH